MEFYKTTITVEVLGNTPYQFDETCDWGFAKNARRLMDDIMYGPFSGLIEVTLRSRLTEQELIAECDRHQTCPEFFLGPDNEEE